MRMAERIYRQGILPSGERLHGIHPGGVEVSGANAACVLCHRRSGMGMIEGRRVVLPIAGPFLLQPRAQTAAELNNLFARSIDFAHAYGMNRTLVPYTDNLLARAIRKGINAAGKPLDDLMPRFSLNAANTQLLVKYIERLSDQWSPGVTEDTMRFATVFTPGVDLAKRQAMLEVLRSYFEVRNTDRQRTNNYERGHARSGYKTARTWELQFWFLHGPEDTWGKQLSKKYRRHPVFALISGLAQGSWQPVHEFCERQRLPCWFPTVDAPVVAEDDFYSTYFSRGVFLEADILAQRFSEQYRQGTLQHVLQIGGNNPTASAATGALRHALQWAGGVPMDEWRLKKVTADALRQIMTHAGPNDGVVFWLTENELVRLEQVPVPTAAVYFSAIMDDGEKAPLPPAWRAQAQMAYPFELPGKRKANMSFFRAWLKRRNVPLLDERVQTDAYLACEFMAQQIDAMNEYLFRDYLLERAENKLSSKLENPHYRHLSLGPGQHFAAKGGYIVRLRSPDNGQMKAETGYIVP